MPDSASTLLLSYRSRMPERSLACIGFPALPAAQPLLGIETGLPLLAPQAVRFEVLGSTKAQRIQLGDDAALAIRHAHDGEYLLGTLSVAESGTDSIDAAAHEAYRRIAAFNNQSGYPHVMRIWNYMDDINQGDGDCERYKQFCVGRARGWTDMNSTSFPAASAVGRPLRRENLLVYWLAAKQPGVLLENPRQVSAFNYPRQYGPTAPGFARATLLANGLLMVSGTASIVGHASQHPGDVVAQTHETLNNLEALIAHARQHAAHLPETLGARSLLKVYVRHAEHAALIEDVLRARCATVPDFVMLHADICRRELLLEMDCVHGLPNNHV